MQHAQISCNKREMKITDCEAEGAKEVDMKSKLCHHNVKKEYNRSYEAILMIIKSGLNDDITKKKRK